MLRPLRRMKRRNAAPWSCMLAATALTSGCLVDPDRRCDEYQQESDTGLNGCECVAGSVLSKDKHYCTPCGAEEEVVQGACACKAGFARPSEGAACVMSALGAPCTSSSDCSGDFPYCAAKGYCTISPCASNAECGVTGYACETTASPPYCSRPPSGQGKPCATDGDCAGTEAPACLAGGCLVTGCKETGCHGTWVCCDFTSIGVPDVCIPGEQLISGACPVTMAPPVKR